MEWNYADVYEAIAAARPDAACQVRGDRVVSWRDFDRRANALAGTLLDAGLGHQAKVAVYLRNRPEFLEAYVACFKAGLIPVNVNFRYGIAELLHVFRNADVEAVVFQGDYGETLQRCREQLASLRHFWVVDDGSGAPSWARSYEETVDEGRDRVTASCGRSGDDAILLYTGGTTGLPKGVLWRQNEVFKALGEGGNFYMGQPPNRDLDELVSRLQDKRLLVLCPLMHATGLFTALSLMNEGWAIETSASERFDAAATWDLIAAHRINGVVMVGDAFARPMLTELKVRGRTEDLRSLEIMISAGSVWSQDARAELVELLPGIALSDNYGSSEALRGVQTYSRAGEVPRTGVIASSELLKMVDEQGRFLGITKPGTRGMLALTGHLAEGYYKDPERSASTWKVIDGVRCCLTGDFGSVEPDGTIRLLGRGASVINSGGEKVYPQEVEGVLRSHPAVDDAAVIGVPDERFGQAITALVVPARGAEVALGELSGHVKEHLAGYKAPRHLVLVDTVPRNATGKIDYARCQALATQSAAARRE